MHRWLLYFTFLLSSVAHAEECALTLNAAIRIALDQNPSARAAVEGIYIAQAAEGQARAPYYPNLEFTASYSRWQRHLFFPALATQMTIPSILGPLNDYNFYFSSRYTLFDSGKRHSELLSKLAQKHVAKEEWQRVRQELILNTSVAFFTVVADRDLYEVKKQALERAQDHVSIVDQRLKAGAVPPADLLKTEVDLANAKLDLVQAETMLRTAMGQLSVNIGLPPNSKFCIAAQEGAIQDPDKICVQQALCAALQFRPELAASRARLNSLYFQIQSKKSDYGPNVYAEGTYGWHDSVFFPKDHEWLIGVTAKQKLFNGFETEYSVCKAEAEWYQEQANWESLRLNLQQQVWESYHKLNQAFESIKLTQAQHEDARESLRLTTERYKAGASTINDLLDAEVALRQAEANQIAALWEYRSAYVRFLWAQGLLCVEL